MSAHTVGHWHVEDPLGDDAGDALWIVADGATSEVYDWRCIAIVTSDDPDETDNPMPIGVAERDANARLIASAPALLEACLALIQYDERDDEGPNAGVQMMIDYDHALTLARTAIAQAVVAPDVCEGR